MLKRISPLKKMNIVMYSESILANEVFFAPILVAFYLNFIGLSFEQMSLFFAISLVFSWILEVPSGAFSDWFGRKRAFILGKIIYIFTLLLLLVFKDFSAILILAFTMSMGNAISSGNLSSIIYENLDDIGSNKDSFFRMTSKASSIGFLVSALAAVTGGYLGNFDLRIPLIIDIIMFTASLIITLIFLEERSKTYLLRNNKHDVKGLVTQKIKHAFIEFGAIIKDGLMIIRNKKRLSCLIVFSALCFGILRSTFNFYQPMFDDLAVDLSIFGIILAVFNIIAAGTSYLSSKLPSKVIESNTLLILGIILIVSSGILVYLFSSFVYLIAIAFGLHQVVRGFMTPFISYSINKEIPIGDKSRTTLSSFDYLLKAFSGTVFLSLSGILVSGTGLFSGFILLTVLGGLLLITVFLIQKVLLRKEKDIKSDSRSIKNITQ